MHAQFHALRNAHLKTNSNWFFGELGLNLNTQPPQIPYNFKFTELYRAKYPDFSKTAKPSPFGASFIQEFHNLIPVSHYETGALLFVAERYTIYDKNLDPMPNGNFDADTFFAQNEMATTVVPFVDDRDKYFFSAFPCFRKWALLIL